MLDLIVIGAGLTGLMAAYTAARAGLKVKVIARGLGALHWSTGAVDVLGCWPDECTLVECPLQMIGALAKAQPQHPYALLGENGLAEALTIFAKLTHEAGLPYLCQDSAGHCNISDSVTNWRLTSPVGAARPTFLVPQAQQAGELSRPEPMLIVGFQGMRDFFPCLIAENLVKQGYRARAEFLPLNLITDRCDSSTVQLASGLDSPARRSALSAALKKLIQPGESVRIGLPAILGMSDHAALMDELRAATGADVFEIPTLPPSVPGIRLNSALRREVERLGVRVEVNMNVIGFHAQNKRIEWIETETSARPLKHQAANFLLATGGILGGGINTDHTGRAWEVVFNLPLTVPGRRSEWFRTRFLDPRGHPIFYGGVPVNRQLQPIDADGAPVYSNLWAAGGILAHTDPIREHSLEGISIATGIAAAQHIVKLTTGH